MQRLLLACLAGALLLAGCADSGDDHPDDGHAHATHQVSIHGFEFDPASLTIAVGDSVRFENHDSTQHNAKANDGAWGTRNLALDGSDTIPFDTAGTFAYRCTFHSGMQGTITVR